MTTKANIATDRAHFDLVNEMESNEEAWREEKKAWRKKEKAWQVAMQKIATNMKEAKGVVSFESVVAVALRLNDGTLEVYDDIKHLTQQMIAVCESYPAKVVTPIPHSLIFTRWMWGQQYTR
jgi:hypothetical protein